MNVFTKWFDNKKGLQLTIGRPLADYGPCTKRQQQPSLYQPGVLVLQVIQTLG